MAAVGFDGKFDLYDKTLRGMRTQMQWMFVAEATHLRRRIPQAGFFFTEKGMPDCANIPLILKYGNFMD